MYLRLVKSLGVVFFIVVASYFLSTKEDIFTKAMKLNLNATVTLKLAKSTYNLELQKLNPLDESKIDFELKKIHQIQSKISSSYFSKTSDIIITFAKSIDQNLVLVIFKNQQIQMIQKVYSLSLERIEFQYGTIDIHPEKTQIALSENIVELDF